MEERIPEIEPRVLNAIERGYSFNMGQYLEEGWENFKKKPSALVLPLLIVLAFSGIVLGLFAFVLPVKMINALSNVLQFAVAPIGASFYIIAQKVDRNEDTEWRDIFLGYKFWIPIVVATLLSALIMTLGFICLILPGIYLAVGYSFTTLFIALKNYDFWPAMEASRKIVSKNWFSFFLFLLVVGFINLLGALFIGIGLLVTIPVSILASYAAFKDIVLSLEEETEIEDNLLLE